MLSDKPIIIAGGGIAGITAAHELTRMGFNVMLLEAKDRLGGRINTFQLDGTTVEAGANWRHVAEGNPLNRFYRSEGITMVPTPSDIERVTLFDQGRVVENKEEIATSFELFTRSYRSKKPEFYRDNNINTIGDLIRYYENDTTALKQYGGYTASTAHVRDVATALLKDSKGVDIDEIPVEYLINFDHEVVNITLYDARHRMPLGKQFNAMESSPGKDDLVVGGHDVVIKGLLAEMETHPGQFSYRLNTSVVTMDTSVDNQATVTYQDKQSGETQQILGQGVVCALPVGVIQQQLRDGKPLFVPALQPDKQHAMLQFKEAVMNKVFLKFDSAFWKDEANYHTFFMKQAGGEYQSVVNLDYVQGEPVLVVIFSGNAAKFPADVSDEQITADVLANLKQVFGEDKVPAPKASHVTRWHQDPNALGSYRAADDHTYNAVTTIVDKPEGVVFAGEYLSRYSSVHGAHVTGLYAAYDLIQQLSQQPAARAMAIEKIVEDYEAGKLNNSHLEQRGYIDPWGLQCLKAGVNIRLVLLRNDLNAGNISLVIKFKDAINQGLLPMEKVMALSYRQEVLLSGYDRLYFTAIQENKISIDDILQCSDERASLLHDSCIRYYLENNKLSVADAMKLDDATLEFLTSSSIHYAIRSNKFSMQEVISVDSAHRDDYKLYLNYLKAHYHLDEVIALTPATKKLLNHGLNGRLAERFGKDFVNELSMIKNPDFSREKYLQSDEWGELPSAVKSLLLKQKITITDIYETLSANKLDKINHLTSPWYQLLKEDKISASTIRELSDSEFDSLHDPKLIDQVEALLENGKLTAPLTADNLRSLNEVTSQHTDEAAQQRKPI